MSNEAELVRQLAKLDAMDDQDWAAGCDWLRGSSMDDVLNYRQWLVDDDPSELIVRMEIDHAIANVTQRLALLALDEVIKRVVRQYAWPSGEAQE